MFEKILLICQDTCLKYYVLFSFEQSKVSLIRESFQSWIQQNLYNSKIKYDIYFNNSLFQRDQQLKGSNVFIFT